MIIRTAPAALSAANENRASAFVVGRTYYDRSICDHDCIFSFTIVKRTAKTITFKAHGKMTTRGVKMVDGVEQCKPFGTYSMCSIIRADKLAA